MADGGLRAQPAFHGHLAFTGMGIDRAAAGVTLETRDDLALAIVMARKGQSRTVAARVKAAFGIDLPFGPRRLAAERVAFVGIGPGQWLAVEEGGDEATFGSRLGSALGDAASISEQSDSRAVLRLAGPRARDVLAKGLAIDLHPRAFGPGDAAASAIGLIGAQLWQLDDKPTYEILAPRSLAESFADFIWASAAEYGVALMA